MADDYVPYEVDDYPGDPSNYPDDIDNADDAYDEASAIIHNEDEPFENEDEQANIAAAAPVGSANRRFVTAVKRLIKSSGENISDSTIDNWALRSQKLPHFRYLSSRCLAMLWLWRGTADATVRGYSTGWFSAN